MKTVTKTAIISLAIAVTLLAGGTSALAKGGKKDHDHKVKGTVVAVSADSITIATKKHGEKQFKLSANTVVLSGHHKKHHGQNGGSSISQVHQGEHVKLIVDNGVVEKIHIKKEHKKHGGKGGPAPNA